MASPSDLCSICLDSLTNMKSSTSGLLSTPCEHYFHRECLMDWCIKGNPGTCCPYCKKGIKWSDAIPVVAPIPARRESVRRSTPYPQPSSSRYVFKRIAPSSSGPATGAESQAKRPKESRPMSKNANIEASLTTTPATASQSPLRTNLPLLGPKLSAGSSQNNTETRWQWANSGQPYNAEHIQQYVHKLMKNLPKLLEWVQESCPMPERFGTTTVIGNGAPGQQASGQGLPTEPFTATININITVVSPPAPSPKRYPPKP